MSSQRPAASVKSASSSSLHNMLSSLTSYPTIDQQNPLTSPTASFQAGYSDSGAQQRHPRNPIVSFNSHQDGPPLRQQGEGGDGNSAHVSSRTRSYSHSSVNQSPISSPLRDRAGSEFPSAPIHIINTNLPTGTPIYGQRMGSSITNLILPVVGHPGASNDPSPRELTESHGRVMSPYSTRGGSTDDSTRHPSDSRHASVQRGRSFSTSPQLAPVTRTATTGRPPNPMSNSSSMGSGKVTSPYLSHSTIHTFQSREEVPLRDHLGDSANSREKVWNRSLSGMPQVAAYPTPTPNHGAPPLSPALRAPTSHCNSPRSSNHSNGPALFGAVQGRAVRGDEEAAVFDAPPLSPNTSHQSMGHPPITGPRMYSMPINRSPTSTGLAPRRQSLTVSPAPLRTSPKSGGGITLQQHMQRHQFVRTVDDALLSEIAPLAREWTPTQSLSSLNAHQRMYLSSVELVAFTAVEKELLQLQDAYHAIYRSENISERRRQLRKRSKSKMKRLTSDSTFASAEWNPSPVLGQSRASLLNLVPSSSQIENTGLAVDGAEKCIESYIRSVLRLASLPTKLMDPEMGVVQYNVLLRRLRRTGYISFESTASPTAPITLLFAGNLHTVLSSASAIALHRHTDSLFHRQHGKPTTTPAPPLEGGSPIANTTSKSSQDGSEGTSGSRVGTSRAASVGGVSLMGKTTSNVSLTQQQCRRSGDASGGRNVFEASTSKNPLVTSTHHDLVSMGLDLSTTAGRSLPDESHLVDRFTYFVAVSPGDAGANPLEAALMGGGMPGMGSSLQPDTMGSTRRINWSRRETHPVENDEPQQQHPSLVEEVASQKDVLGSQCLRDALEDAETVVVPANLLPTTAADVTNSPPHQSPSMRESPVDGGGSVRSPTPVSVPQAVSTIPSFLSAANQFGEEVGSEGGSNEDDGDELAEMYADWDDDDFPEYDDRASDEEIVDAFIDD